MIERIEADLKAAMLARDAVRVSVMRSILNGLRAEAKNQQRDLNENEQIAVLRKEAKQRDEAAEAFSRGGAEDRAEAERAERAIIDSYLPQPLSEAELDDLVKMAVEEVGADIKNLGKIIGLVMERSGGRAEGVQVAKLAREKLS